MPCESDGKTRDQNEVGGGDTDFAESQRAGELRSIRLHISDGLHKQALKQLDERGAAQELVRQQYTHRYPFELLQNADDAARDSGKRGRARFVLTQTALIVADNGTGFGDEQVAAICSLGRSSKGPGKSIGHKGLGFKSVGEVTTRPQIVSPHTKFQFDADRLRNDLEAEFGALSPKLRLPVYAFPYPIEPGDLGDDAAAVSALQEDGYTTIIRLPFHDSITREDVADNLLANLNPRLLLFLPFIDHLEVRGTDRDFWADVAREPGDDVDRVLMMTGDGSEEWLVYRGSTTPDPSALKALGDEWAELTEARFAVAVPLDPNEARALPRTDETFPLHVYFPTEELPGLHVAVHAEWVLTMDRRRISSTPEATLFNEQLMEAVAEFAASTVSVDLVNRCDRSLESIRLLVPGHVTDGDGAAKTLSEHWRRYLASVAFLPLADDESLCTPAEVVLLPDSIPDYEEAQRYFALPAEHTLRADVESDQHIRHFLLTSADVETMTDEDLLSRLGELNAAAAPDFYSFLIKWRSANYFLVDKLKAVPCVLTTGGQFLATAEHSIFFPRHDESVPDDIPVPIAALTDLTGVDRLLRDLDVRSFEWRDLIRDYLIKILAEPDAPENERARAMGGLRAYQAARRDPEEVGPANLGRVLIPATSVDGARTALRRADRVYFGRDWTRTDDLERIYGSFGQSEFLAVAAPADPTTRDKERDFYRMLGVVDHPRLIPAGSASLRLDAGNNPHRKTNVALYNEWLQAVGARTCQQDHDSTHQRLTLNFHVDRLEAIVAAQDPHINRMLWNQLARNWSKIYEDAMVAQLRCDHRFHSGDRVRSTESLFAYTMQSRPWVPVAIDNSAHVALPREAWYETSPPPARIRSRIPLISRQMHDMRGGPALVNELGLIDTSRPTVDDLLHLLEGVAAEADDIGATNQAVEAAARWIQRGIDDMLGADTDPHPCPNDVRVLAMYNGITVFTSQPPYADDTLLRDTWQRIEPILLADNDSGRLKRFLGLTRLDSEVEVSPSPLNIRRDQLLAGVVRRIDDAKPYIVAVIGSENSRMQPSAAQSLRHLQVIVCEQLVLQYRHSGKVVERTDATCFIATSEAEHRQSTGTAYIEVDRDAAQPDWFALGSQLAQHLGVGSHADAVTMLLKLDADDRDRMMANRNITVEALDRARKRLDMPADDERPSASILDGYLARPQQDLTRESDATVPSPAMQSDATPVAGDAAPRDASADSSAPAAEGTVQPPDVDFASVTVSDAIPSMVAAPHDGHNNRMPSIVLGATSSAPSVATESEKRRVGRRGEGIVFRMERDRVEARGSNPDVVVWQSRDDELAPVDILSVDEHGEIIYIEVKSTVVSDPTEPFYISDAELVAAGFHGSRYYIYRVTDVDTASPRITRWRNPIELINNGLGRLLLGTAQMKLGLESPSGGG
jgi:hypothetical protein